MRQHNVKLILNPNADMGNAWRLASDLRPIVDEFGGADWAGTVYPTHAIELATQAANEGYETVIAAGGDGPVHEVINGLMEAKVEKRPTLGVIPLGSGNDFSANVGNTRDSNQAVQAILEGHTKTIDLATIEDEEGRMEFWDNTANIGFGGSVTEYSHSLPVLRGFIMYLAAVLQTIFSNYVIMKAEIRTDEKEWTDETIMIALNNGPREGGGFHTGPHAIMNDGVLNFTIAQKVSRLKMLMLIPLFMNGTQEKDSKVYMGTFKTMEIRSDKPLYLHTDGEMFAGFNHNVHYLKIEILPQAPNPAEWNLPVCEQLF